MGKKRKPLRRPIDASSSSQPVESMNPSKKKKDSSTRSVDESDDEGIDLEGDISVKSEDFTFEFNDMRKTYTEGITVLLKKYIVNPTAAYEIASALTDQGIAFDDRANSVYSTILNYRINIINQK